MNEPEVMVFLMSLMILAGVAVLWMAMHSRRQIREMEHRERLAMIERGLVPAPEVDPGQFERKFGIASPEPRTAGRFRSAGVIMIGLGGALMMIISFAAETPSVGIGIGGAFALLGATFLFNGMMLARSEPLPMRPPLPYVPPSPPRREPPDRQPEP